MLCDCYLELGEAMTKLGRPLEASLELEEGVLLVTQGDGPEAELGPMALARLIIRLAEVKLQLDEQPEAARLIAHALRIAAPSDNELDKSRVQATAAVVLHALGKLDEAQALRRQVVEGLRLLGDRRATAEQLLALADDADGNARMESHRRAWLLEAERLAHQVDWREGTSKSREHLRKLG